MQRILDFGCDKQLKYLDTSDHAHSVYDRTSKECTSALKYPSARQLYGPSKLTRKRCQIISLDNDADWATSTVRDNKLTLLGLQWIYIRHSNLYKLMEKKIGVIHLVYGFCFFKLFSMGLKELINQQPDSLISMQQSIPTNIYHTVGQPQWRHANTTTILYVVRQQWCSS